MRWSYRATDMLTGRVLADHVPFSKVRFTDTLSNGGTFTGTYRYGDPKMPIYPWDSIGKTMIWPCRDGVPQGAYVVTSIPNHDQSAPDVPVQGDRFDAILNRREVQHDLNFAAEDVFAIVRDLLRYAGGIATVNTTTTVVDTAAVAPSKALPWLRWSPTLSGVTATRQVSTTTTSNDGWSGTAGKFVGGLLADLIAETGLEYRCDYGWDDGVYWARVTLGIPVGVTRTSDRKVILEFPSKAVPKCTAGADGRDFATRLRVVGKERDGKRPTGVAVNRRLLDLGYPLWDRNITSGAATETPRLAQAASIGLSRASIATGYQITINPDAEPEWGSYRIGDHVVLRVRRGGVQMPDQVQRIGGWTITPSDTGDGETIVPQLIEAA